MDSKMTFADLDDMVNYWALDLNDYQCQFHNQAATLNSLFWETEFNSIKFGMIEKRMSILYYMQMKLEADIQNANACAETVEQMITKLEEKHKVCGGTFDGDTRELYNLFTKIDDSLYYYKNEVELIIRDTTNIEKDNIKNPIEYVAKIMSALLKTLDFIEMKMEQMKNRMHWIDREIRTILCEILYKQ